MTHPFSLSTFIDDLASGEPTPGGGSAAALAGALGAALAAMVARLTVGRKRYADVEPSMQAVLDEADGLRIRLTQLVTEDAQAYEAVRAAYKLPKESELDQHERGIAIQNALQAASATPLETMRACIATMQLAERAASLGNVNAAADGAVGVLLAYAGLQGAALNVRVNLGSIEDQNFVATSEQAAARWLNEGTEIAGRILSIVAARQG